MEKQKIKDYRELSKEEIDLINRIKTTGAELLKLQQELTARLDTDTEYKLAEACRSIKGMEFEGRPYTVYSGSSKECDEYRRFEAAEPLRWAAIAKTDIQQGIMALVRAIAQPETLC